MHYSFIGISNDFRKVPFMKHIITVLLLSLMSTFGSGGVVVFKRQKLDERLKGLGAGLV
jgi:hypothetical protein